MAVIVLDLETTGLDTETAHIIEVAAMDLYSEDTFMHFAPYIYQFSARHHGDALMLNRYFERGVHKMMEPNQESTLTMFRNLHSMLKGNTVAGSNPDFDTRLLSRQFRSMGLEPEPWHHRKVDLSNVAGTVFGLPYTESPGLAKVCEILHLDFNDAHSAMGDVKVTRQALKMLESMRMEMD